MAYFIYQGGNSETIASSPLILVSNEVVDSVTGQQRNKVQSEPTISRPIVNEYGVISDHLVFSYCLMKQDGEAFTEREQIAIERWLTSPKFSSGLTIVDCNGVHTTYYGMFTSTEWILGSGGFILCKFTFEVNGTYPFREYYDAKSAAHYEDGELISIDDEFDFDLFCYTDEMEEYIYPRITITSVQQSGDKTQCSIINKTDNNSHISLEFASAWPIYIDNQHCTVSRIVNQKIVNLKYRQVGWDTVDSINWFRLHDSENKLHINGQVKVEFEYIAPVKKVGGWLV